MYLSLFFDHFLFMNYKKVKMFPAFQAAVAVALVHDYQF